MGGDGEGKVHRSRRDQAGDSLRTEDLGAAALPCGKHSRAEENFVATHFHIALTLFRGLPSVSGTFAFQKHGLSRRTCRAFLVRSCPVPSSGLSTVQGSRMQEGGLPLTTFNFVKSLDFHSEKE